jgi:very-short-patch-repair endonuclease
MIAMPSEQPRRWARRDRSISAPQRAHARQMRKMPTDAERTLWSHLRHRLPLVDSHFRRQVRIGPYIVDFVCHRSKLIIEVDGGQHAQNAAADRQRTRRLEADGYRVLRFWNNDVLSNVDGVLTEIQRAISQALPQDGPPPPTPPHKGEGRK